MPVSAEGQVEHQKLDSLEKSVPSNAEIRVPFKKVYPNIIKIIFLIHDLKFGDIIFNAAIQIRANSSV